MTQRQIELNNRSCYLQTEIAMTSKGEKINRFLKLMNDSHPEKDSLLAEFFNENVNFNLHFLMKTEYGNVIPIQFEQQELSFLKIHRSFEDKIKRTTISLSFNSKKTDVLVSEQYNYDTKVMKFHIYFSDKCTKDMAATSYFICEILAICTFLANTTLAKLSTNTIKRYGSTLTPINFESFMNTKLALLIHEWINSNDTMKMFTGYIQCNNLKDVNSDRTFIDCTINEDEMKLNLMYSVNGKLGLLTYCPNILFLGYI